MHTCGTWLLLYATPTHLPSICPFTHLYVLISALSNPMYLPPALWAWIRAPATHFLGARILITSTTSTPPAALSALPQHLPPPFSVIVLSSQYLFQRGPILIYVPYMRLRQGLILCGMCVHLISGYNLWIAMVLHCTYYLKVKTHYGYKYMWHNAYGNRWRTYNIAGPP